MVDKICVIYVLINLNFVFSTLAKPQIRRFDVDQSLFFWNQNPFFQNYDNILVPSEDFQRVNLINFLFKPEDFNYQPNFQSLLFPAFSPSVKYSWFNQYYQLTSTPLFFDPRINLMNNFVNDEYNFNDNPLEDIKKVDPDVLRFINELDLERIVDELENNFNSVDLNHHYYHYENDNIGQVNDQDKIVYKPAFLNEKYGQSFGSQTSDKHGEKFEKLFDDEDDDVEKYESNYKGNYEKDKMLNSLFEKDQKDGKYENKDVFEIDEKEKKVHHQVNNIDQIGERVNMLNDFKSKLNYDKKFDQTPDWRPYFDYPTNFYLQLQNRRNVKKFNKNSNQTVTLDYNLPKN